MYVQEHQYVKCKIDIIFEKFAVIWTCLSQQAPNHKYIIINKIPVFNVKIKNNKIINYAYRIQHKKQLWWLHTG